MKTSTLALTAILVMLIVMNFAYAQNPKTNARKINGNTIQPPSPVPPPKPQTAPKPDYNNYKRDTAFRENDQPEQQNNDHLSSSSSHSNSNKVLFNAGLIVGLTQNEFREATNGDWGIGLGITLMNNFMGTNDKEKSPVNIYLGGTFEYLYFGGKSNSYNYHDPYPYNAINNQVTTSVNSNIYSLMLVSRIEFFNGPVVPFIEGAIGGRLFDGKEKVRIERTQEPGSTLPPGITFAPATKDFSDNLQSDVVGTMGYGGGLRLGSSNFKVELKVMYMLGSKGKYIDNESIQFDQGSNSFTYTTKTSTTDMLIPQISVSANF